ncbi:MAG: hypothetical protein QOJ54_3238 [Aliidongia sp.]|jgi:hypothetical protein|nr:hypothetical protein [Aliidongia sp.]
MTVDFSALTGKACKSAFGVPATYLPATGGTIRIIGIYDDAYDDVSIDGAGSRIVTTSPVLGMQPGDLPAPPLRGDRLIVQSTGETFIVKEVRPDSHGWAQLMLNLAY